jgi:hypothetical protein
MDQKSPAFWSSWPDKSAKRVFASNAPAIHLLQTVDTRAYATPKLLRPRKRVKPACDG